MMKKNLPISLLSFLTLGLAQMDQAGITVTGTGTTYGEPDMAVVDLGVDSVDKDVAVASSKTDEVAKALLETFTKLGIESKDVRTSYFNTFRETPYNPDGTTGEAVYHVQNVMSITLRDIRKVGQLITESIASGANVVNNVQYTLSNSAILEGEARNLAMQNAQQKAQQLAELGGVTLGDIVMITDVSASVPSPLPYARDATLEASAASIPAGQLEVTATVSVRFEITQR
ncbi:MAG: SIMPL domain-containing protein [Trueperaceae bacterium]